MSVFALSKQIYFFLRNEKINHTLEVIYRWSDGPRCIWDKLWLEVMFLRNYNDKYYIQISAVYMCLCLLNERFLVAFLRSWRRKSNNLKRWFFSLFIWCFPLTWLQLSNMNPLCIFVAFWEGQLLAQSGRTDSQCSKPNEWVKTYNAAVCCKHFQILSFPNMCKHFCPSKTRTEDHLFKKRKAWIIRQKG